MSVSEQFVLVVGCGRLGAHVATELAARGHSVVVVDVSEAAFAALGPAFGGFTIEGDATEMSVLRQAGIEKASLLIATTSSDNANLMVAQIAAKLFGVSKVFARVMEPRREASFRDRGIVPISPTGLAAERMIAAMSEDKAS